MGAAAGKELPPGYNSKQPQPQQDPPQQDGEKPKDASPKEEITVVPPPVDEGHAGEHPLAGSSSQVGSTPFLAEAPPCKYIKKQNIGKGAFGEAYIVERVSDGQKFVAKIMDLHSMSSKDRRYAQTEILCLAHSQHFSIINYTEHVVIDDDSIVIVMEYADNGDLYNNMKKNKMVLSEREAGLYFVQLLLALDHIHRRRMIHRDIKSANVFLTKTGFLKLGDFGFSQQYDQTVSNPIATTFLGTPYYLAPEMWRGNRYGKKADMWAAGIVLYELLTTKRPFLAQNMPSLKHKVLEGSFDTPPNISRDMADLVNAILVQDPAKRVSAQQALRKPLMQHYITLLEKHIGDSKLISEEVREVAKSNIKDSIDAMRQQESEELAAQAVTHEGSVWKESDGVWKERYLILRDSYLTMTLSKGREAPPGAERSKRIPLSAVHSAVPISSKAQSRFAFAISTSSSSAIVMAVKTSEERDEWVAKLLQALDM